MSPRERFQPPGGGHPFDSFQWLVDNRWVAAVVLLAVILLATLVAWMSPVRDVPGAPAEIPINAAPRLD
jgi:hypothetical protein